VQSIIDTTEFFLQTTSQFDLTVRKIAMGAGVSDRMIHYYFNDKDGLIFAVIARYCDDVAKKLKLLDAVDPAAPWPTRRIFKIVMEAYYAKPWIARILASELSRDHSAVRESYMKRYGRQAQARTHLRRVFVRLIDSGVYDRRMDLDKAVLSAFYTCAAPVMVAPLAGDLDPNLPQCRDDAWINYVADLFERGVRVGSVQ